MSILSLFSNKLEMVLDLIQYPEDKQEVMIDIIQVVSANSILDFLETIPDKNFSTLEMSAKTLSSDKLAMILPKYFTSPEFEVICAKNFTNTLSDFIKTLEPKVTPVQKIKLQLILQNFLQSLTHN